MLSYYNNIFNKGKKELAYFRVLSLYYWPTVTLQKMLVSLQLRIVIKTALSSQYLASKEKKVLPSTQQPIIFDAGTFHLWRRVQLHISLNAFRATVHIFNTAQCIESNRKLMAQFRNKEAFQNSLSEEHYWHSRVA